MMSENQFEREKNYQVAMHISRQLLEKEHITQKEYEEINEIMIEKYEPPIGSLTSKKFPKWDQEESDSPADNSTENDNA